MIDERARVPSFARSFPRDAAVDALVAAFTRGDYARVRREAAALERSTEDDAIKRAARTLIERTEADPLAVALIVLAAVLLALVGGWWTLFGKAPPSAAPSSPPAEHAR